MNYQEIITLEPGKRSGKPCIRGMRITVYDILSIVDDDYRSRGLDTMTLTTTMRIDDASYFLDDGRSCW
jgi:hypothetical protein